MEIKDRLVEILHKENYTFKQLADFLEMNEEHLTNELNNKTLDLKSFEIISKALRVPLYSFFRNDNTGFNYNEKPYYINKLWSSR
jgi:hypothetical protein